MTKTREEKDLADTASTPSSTLEQDIELVGKLRTTIGKIVVGQQEMIHRLLIGLFTGGHILLEGVPGLAKTLTVETLSKALRLQFKRIQFTPDLLPSDLIGTMIYHQQKGDFQVKKGPVFAQIVLADEINRAPAKVQAALLEAMQEKQVTIGETSYKLPQPFLVLATQNPLEQEGTYTLPEAQVDRFMMRVFVNYPSQEEELEIIRRITDLSFQTLSLDAVLDQKDISRIQRHMYNVSITDSISRYIVSIVSATRRPAEYGLEELQKYVRFGASPRASIYMYTAARAWAFFQQRDYVLPQDIKEIASDILNHRVILNYEAAAEGLTTENFVKKILEKIPIHK